MRSELAYTSLETETPAVSEVTLINRENSYITEALHIQCSLKDVTYALFINSHWRNYLSSNLKILKFSVMADAEFLKKKASQIHRGENLYWLTRVWLQVFSAGKPVTWEACRYLEVLVATKQWVVKPIAATSYSSPSLRGTWLLKVIMHFCSEKWADSSTDSSSTSSAKILTHLWNLLWEITLFSRSLVWRTPPDLLENLAAVNQTDFQGWGTSKWNPRGVFLGHV